MHTHNLTMNNQPQVLYVCFIPLATWGHTHGHIQTHNLTMKNQPYVLYMCFKPLATWWHMDTRRHIRSQWTTNFRVFIGSIKSLATWGHLDTCRGTNSQWKTSLRCYTHVSNHWLHGGTWIQGNTLVTMNMGTSRHMSAQCILSIGG